MKTFTTSADDSAVQKVAIKQNPDFPCDKREEGRTRQSKVQVISSRKDYHISMCEQVFDSFTEP